MLSGVRNLKQAIMPIMWLNCIFCMGIFEIPINRPRYFLSGFYVIFMLTGYCILFYNTIHILLKEFLHEFSIFYLVVAVNILVAILAIILFWKRSEVRDNISYKISVEVTNENYGKITLMNCRNINIELI